MRHIVNGDATLALLRQTAIAGEARSWPDILLEGPVANGLAGAADWQQRAAYLETYLRIPAAPYRERMAAALSALAAWDGAEELTLWFEDDLFCQIHLFYLLDRLAGRLASGAPLTLICPPESLGTRTPAALATLFAERRPVTSERVALARRAWAAYAAADPRAVEQLLQADFSVWPLLAQGLRAHLDRFPAPESGLNMIEAGSLGRLRDGPLAFTDLFAAVTRPARIRRHGMGDRQLAATLAGLSDGDRPMLRIADRDARADAGESVAFERFPAWRLSITSDGQAALAGKLDAVSRWPAERWLGGVRLGSGTAMWRWDGSALRVTA